MKKYNFTKNSILKIINEVKIIDIHTHLFPWNDKKNFLSGLNELLNYHYLTAEFLSSSGTNPKNFFKFSKSKRAELVWNFLFVNRTPISEASRGVVKIINFLNIKNYEKNNYSEILKKYNSIEYDKKKILNKLNISKVVMTNNPFDESEWSLFKKKNWEKKIFKSSIRLDDLFKNKLNYKKKDLELFLKKSIKISNPIYFAISVDGKNIKKIFNSTYMKDVVFPLLKNKKLPLMILMGVKRGVNKNYKDGGDGIGDEDCEILEEIIKKNQNINFLVTHLSDLSQYKLIVLSRKFSNLKLFGFWWYLNQKEIIKNILHQKLNLLGFNFIAQHSDARVYEQLIYKWINFKEILSEVLFEKYISLKKIGYNLSKQQIKNDLEKILNPNLKNL